MDRFTDIPKDILELILYETDPKDIDTFCQINDRINNLCKDNKVIHNYFIHHNLFIDGPYESFLEKIINSKSTILTNYLIRWVNYNNFGDRYTYSIIYYLIKNKEISDIDIFNHIKLLIEIFNVKLNDPIIFKVTDGSVRYKRKQLIQLLQQADLFDYKAALNYSINYYKYDEFVDTINYMLENNIKISNPIISLIFNQMLIYPDPRYIQFLLNIDDPTFKSQLEEHLPKFKANLGSLIKNPYFTSESDPYKIMFDLLQ